MSGESRINFGTITDVTEIKVEFSVSFVSQKLGVQLEIIGCQECKSINKSKNKI